MSDDQPNRLGTCLALTGLASLIISSGAVELGRMTNVNSNLAYDMASNGILYSTGILASSLVVAGTDYIVKKIRRH